MNFLKMPKCNSIELISRTTAIMIFRGFGKKITTPWVMKIDEKETIKLFDEN